MRQIFALGAALLCATAWGQVHKCTDATGKTAFSDTPCSASAARSATIMGADATEQRYDPYAAQRNMESLERVRLLQQGSADVVARQSRGSSDADLVGTSPPRSAPQARSFDPNPSSCDTYSARNGCVGGTRNNNSNWSPRRGYYGGGGSADAKYEQEQADARRHAVAASLPPFPRRLTNCSGAYCYDNQGGSYQRDGSGGLQRNDGARCTATRGVPGKYDCR